MGRADWVDAHGEAHGTRFVGTTRCGCVYAVTVRARVPRCPGTQDGNQLGAGADTWPAGTGIDACRSLISCPRLSGPRLSASDEGIKTGHIGRRCRRQVAVSWVRRRIRVEQSLLIPSWPGVSSVCLVLLNFGAPDAVVRLEKKFVCGRLAVVLARAGCLVWRPGECRALWPDYVFGDIQPWVPGLPRFLPGCAAPDRIRENPSVPETLFKSTAYAVDLPEVVAGRPCAAGAWGHHVASFGAPALAVQPG